MSESLPLTWFAGGCHCGGVRFEVALPPVVEAQTCNCSMCAKTGFLHVIVPESRFRLIKGADRLAEYTFNTRVARHLFCSECGIKSFYRPRSNPDGWSVNGRCLDEADGLELNITAFDGRNWEANSGLLAHLSREPS
ncbi:MAG: GFA family protein [Phenylobacterium sp.]|uniref:GFA family protein n=1 Tax=Phenylobacterium sp. TaxID=1871053 RepID=UPI00273345F4|nr:GFA family protein [Phenylobacterium sp.]MDP3174010.1 GFA family protein [Phenylobacterium sp.]